MLFFEHKHLYRRIKGEVPDERYTTPIGKARIHQEGDDVTVITWGAMVYTAEEAAKTVDASVEIVDLRTIMPWDKEAVLDSVRKTSKVLVLHEDTRTGGFGGEIAATIAEEAFEDLDAPVRRVDGARHTGAVLARAREGVHPAGGRRRQRVEGVDLVLMASTTAVDVVMPQMGVSVSEGTVTKWAKSVGDTIEADETLLEISTDKVDTEVPSPATGVVTEILVQEGETVEVGTVLARIGGERAGSCRTGCSARATDAACGRRVRRSGDRRPGRARAGASCACSRGSGAAGCGGRQRQGVRLTGGCPHRGRARHRPVAGAWNRHGRPRDEEGHPGLRRERPTAAAGARPQAQPAPAPAQAVASAPAEAQAPPAAKPAAAPVPATVGSAQAGETLEPMSAMRRGIAEHMRRSLDTSAHVTSAIEVDMTKVVQIREKLKKEYQSAYGVNPTYLAFIARATVETLRDYPWVNGELRGDQIVTRNYVNLGFAVELADGKGLIVPNLKNAETLNLLGMAKGIADVARRAREKQLTPDDVAGGSFTITNPGGYGTFHGTPVISQPQAGILGTYAIVKRPWVITDENGADAIAIRSMMNLTLTYDHRLVDGAYAGRFLRDLRERLQSWGETDY